MLSAVILAISKSSSKIYLLVYFRIAGTSDAIKLPDGDVATIKGLVFLMAYKVFLSSAQIIPRAYDPRKTFVAAFKDNKMSFFSLYKSAITAQATSVSVSDLKMYPFFMRLSFNSL